MGQLIKIPFVVRTESAQEVNAMEENTRDVVVNDAAVT